MRTMLLVAIVLGSIAPRIHATPDRGFGCEPVRLITQPGFFWSLSGRHFVASRVERCPPAVFAPRRK